MVTLMPACLGMKPEEFDSLSRSITKQLEDGNGGSKVKQIFDSVIAVFQHTVYLHMCFLSTILFGLEYDVPSFA